MLTRTIKRVKLKGKAGVVIREHYLRDDIPCSSPLCDACQLEEATKGIQLDETATHYAIPCIDVVTNYLEILELLELKGFIFLQSIVSKVKQSIGHRFAKRVHNICKDLRHGSILFLNEVCIHTYLPRVMSESFDQWLIRCTAQAVEYYATHLKEKIQIILISDNKEAYLPFIESANVQICNLKDYLQKMWPDVLHAQELYDSLSLALNSGTVKDMSQSYEAYFPIDVLDAGIKSGRFLKGHLKVNKHCSSQEAFVVASKSATKDSGDIFISGMTDRNRAIDGDEVVIEMYAKRDWKSRCMKVVDGDTFKDNDEDGERTTSIPTGKVVGILERRWRNYVATLPEEDEESNATKGRERIIVVPFDYRIPKIRIVTRQAEKIRNQRIVVRIDSWASDSQYPNGHLVQVIGEIGNIETEVQSLLIEHDLFVNSFSQNLLSELPICTEENPWTVDPEEMLKRRDLRESHLVFSIDPKGCEDVDDTLSVRDLSGGRKEIGVHIADVTYFVKPLTLVDLEARSRSTSVYLPDRRYDMLPSVLSGNLCSLLGNVERYAVSVLWELDSNCKVQNVWYGRTLIRSKYKLCYEAAQDILLGATVDEMVPEIPELQNLKMSEMNLRFLELKDALTKLFNIANVIRKDRLSAGGLELNNINMKFEIDQNLPSDVTDIKSKKELAIHKTVAECMIFANHWVARKISEVFPHRSVLRRHPNPREADLAELQKLAELQGITLNTQTNRDLAISLDKAAAKNDPSINQILRILATRTMNQAKYCCTGCFVTEDLYHYGLGLDKYTHFTSPIRRYADIMVHRLLLAAVEVGQQNETKCDSSEEIEEFCNHMNFKHKAAQDLEKNAQDLFLAFFFMKNQSPDKQIICDGIIYSLRSNGVLVYVPKYDIRGAICLCNKEMQVALVVKNEVQWTEGKLIEESNCLAVHSCGVIQRYSMFDHVSVAINVSKPRSHQYKVILDLANNKPYADDLVEIENERNMDLLSVTSVETTESPQETNLEQLDSSKPVEFNLYHYLRKIRAMTMSDNTVIS